jgi:hypothetical protein
MLSAVTEFGVFALCTNRVEYFVSKLVQSERQQGNLFVSGYHNDVS